MPANSRASGHRSQEKNDQVVLITRITKEGIYLAKKCSYREVIINFWPNGLGKKESNFRAIKSRLK